MRYGDISSFQSGVAVPLFSLRSRSGIGIGEYLDLIPFAKWCKMCDFDIIQLLPVNDTGAEASPYSARSAFALNPVFINIQAVQGSSEFENEIEEAKAEFDRAIALDPNEVKARYFSGVAAEQDGRKDDAVTIWRAMLASAPADAPWRPLVQGALARVGVVAPKLSDDTIAAAKDMTEGDRNTMIRGMVDRLATRLKDNGNDVEGWLRLVRAYMVLGERDKAQAALIDARGAVGNDAGRLQQLNDGLKSLGLDG